MNGQPKCPKCGSKQVLYRVQTDTYLCRRCGEVFPKNSDTEGGK